jgi:Kef-type K+ transport system membrane component KefB
MASITEHGLLLMWSQLLVVLAAARGLGLAARRIGQPPLIGELVAGLLLGPSMLGNVWPAAERLIAPHAAAAAAPLNALGWVGVAFLLVLTGFETDLSIVARLGRPAVAATLGGMLLPFAAGIGVGLALPADFAGGHGGRLAFVGFIAVSLAISSLPVIAKILDELGFMRRDFGQLTVAVGMANDLTGWLALGLIAALSRSAHPSLVGFGVPVVAIVAIGVFAFTLGQRGVDYLLAHLRRREAGGIDAMTVTVVVTFAFAAATQLARSDAVLGAYVAGLLIGRSRYFSRRIRTQLEALTMAVFAPLFFATAGLRVDLASLATPQVAIWTAVALAVAVASKLIGASGGAMLAGLGRRESVALGIGLTSRGAMGVVFATVGLSLGVLSPTAATAIILIAIVTSAMAPPLLRAVVRDWRGSPAEQERLDREAALDRNLLIRPGRVLLASRGGPGSVAVARLLAAAWPVEAAVTVLSGEDNDVRRVVSALGRRSVEVRQVPGDPLEASLEEAKLGYSLIASGAQDSFTSGALLSPAVDELLARSPLPLVIARRGRGRYAQVWVGPGRSPRCALVPVAGTPASRTAQEVAYALAQGSGTEVVLTHVVSRPSRPENAGAEADPLPDAALTTAASGVVSQAVAHAWEHAVPARTSVRTGTVTAEEILAAAQQADADLIVLGTTIRRLEDRSFLGHTVEHILDHADQLVIIVATPDTLLAAGVAERDD